MGSSLISCESNLLDKSSILFSKQTFRNVGLELSNIIPRPKHASTPLNLHQILDNMK
jgi:hypothetical protein